MRISKRTFLTEAAEPAANERPLAPAGVQEVNTSWADGVGRPFERFSSFPRLGGGPWLRPRSLHLSPASSLLAPPLVEERLGEREVRRV